MCSSSMACTCATRTEDSASPRSTCPLTTTDGSTHCGARPRLTGGRRDHGLLINLLHAPRRHGYVEQGSGSARPPKTAIAALLLGIRSPPDEEAPRLRPP